MKRRIAILTIYLLAHFSSHAQVISKISQPDHDTTYYRSFKGTIIGRVYLSRNYMQFKLDPAAGIPEMSYRANKPLSLGVGITYKSFSFSFSKGLNFLQSNKRKGATRSTDLQLHLYKRKWTIDALAQFYRGYYLNPRGLGSADGGAYYQRPDMKIQFVGTSVYRVLNDRRFSYGAGFSQNAWQQKSAGSFLLGGQAFYLAAHGDSSFTPRKVDSTENAKNIRKLHLFEIGPGIGYAYMLVIQRHYFFLGSFNANINLRYSREIGNGNGYGRVGFSPNFMLRLGTGYSSSKWSVNFSWIDTGVRAKGKGSDYEYSIGTGNYRLVYAVRFAVNRNMKRIMGRD